MPCTESYNSRGAGACSQPGWLQTWLHRPLLVCRRKRLLQPEQGTAPLRLDATGVRDHRPSAHGMRELAPG